MNQAPKQAYPLQWPVGHPRTKDRRFSQFKQTADRAQQFLRKELGRVGADRIVVSSNIPIRNDGQMYADAMRRKAYQDDPGVAVYFNYKGKPVVMCCDTYNQVWENVYAIGKAIESLRAIDRYGVSDFLARSMTGFSELPPSVVTPFKREWWEVLGVDKNANDEEIKAAYRAKAKEMHPDAGGTTEGFQELVAAMDEALNQQGPN